MAANDSMSDNDTTTGAGRRAENMAAQFLEQRGLAVLTRNYRCRGGEIDLVCRDGKVLVFVEVRLRSNSRFGGAAASITTTKQRRIAHAAQHYLTAKGADAADCRFDCVLLDGTGIDWIRDAFSAG